MKLSEIHINPDNPRLIKDDRFKKLVKSISEFPKMMELRPIIIDSNGMILGGNMRFKALKELKYRDVPDEWVKRADELTDEEKHRFIVSDNVGFGDWDFDALQNWDKDLLMDWGVEMPFDMSTFERPEFTDVDKKPSDKDAKYFYVEYYDNEELFLRLKEKIGKANLDTGNRINSDYFANKILNEI